MCHASQLVLVLELVSFKFCLNQILDVRPCNDVAPFRWHYFTSEFSNLKPVLDVTVAVRHMSESRSEIHFLSQLEDIFFFWWRLKILEMYFFSIPTHISYCNCHIQIITHLYSWSKYSALYVIMICYHPRKSYLCFIGHSNLIFKLTSY